MNRNLVEYGNINIGLPDETFNCFWIFDDLAERFGVEYQSKAVALLKSELKKHVEIKPKPNIDYEADNTSIQSRNADTIFKVAEIINYLAVEGLQSTLSTEERKEIFKQLKAWKRPKRKQWSVGDVFSMELKDGTFMFGQIIDTHITKTSPTCAVFESRKKTTEVTASDFKKSKVISIQNTDNKQLNNGNFSILFGTEPLISSRGVDKRISIGCTMLLNLCNAYCGLEPWNVLYHENHYDKMLRKDVPRPKVALFLDESERNKYRLEHFGIDENNKYVDKNR
jgi:hypothetical protein